MQQSLPSMIANRDDVDASVARAFYSAGIPQCFDMHIAGFVLDPEYKFDAYSQSGND